MNDAAFNKLQSDIRSCTLCSAHLPYGPRPVFRISRTASILIAGQAPGRKVHESGIPFDDRSGDRLREWLGMDRDTFYDEGKIAFVPMGFCYPGSGKSGDLPPRRECAATWHPMVLNELKSIVVTLVIGQYSMDWHLGSRAKRNLTETVRAWRDYQPQHWPLPHPSPRNIIWLKRNPWFESELLPELRCRVKETLNR